MSERGRGAGTRRSAMLGPFGSWCAALALVACQSGGDTRASSGETGRAAGAPGPFRDFVVVAAYPHDPRAYTQGLFFAGGHLFEGTGRFGQSSLRRVHLQTGAVLQRVGLEPQLFGEGIALLDGRIYQLTWRAGRGFVYGRYDLERIGEFSYEGEGWGLTSDGTYLVMSDGTADLRFLDPETLEAVRTLQVRDAEGPVRMLNELEYVEGSILANVWHTSRIVEISPETGEVARWLDFAGLVEHEGADGVESVLNGIAYDAEAQRVFVTGKLWSHVYEVRLRSPDDQSP